MFGCELKEFNPVIRANNGVLCFLNSNDDEGRAQGKAQLNGRAVFFISLDVIRATCVANIQLGRD